MASSAASAEGKVQLIIRNGTVIDPSQDINGVRDVVVQDGKIIGVFEPGSHGHVAVNTFDASGYMVTPGLIDTHVHVYEAATPLGVDPDMYCLARGVTTVLDCGSAGASTMPGLKKHIADRSTTRVFALVNIALQGLAWAGMAGRGVGGELDNMNQVSAEDAIECMRSNPNFVIGVKIRLTANIANQGKSEAPAYELAKKAAKACDRPLMTHHAISVLGLEDCPGRLEPGDIYTHTYHGWPSTILEHIEGTDDDFRVSNHVYQARERGVLFDVGHGAGAFNWRVAEIATEEGFWPDTISTDLHMASRDGPAYDLTTVMTKFLHLGMPVEAIIRATTINAAKALRQEGLGTLKAGSVADISILEIQDCDVLLEDCHKQVRRVRRKFEPVAVFKDGHRHEIIKRLPWPNPESGAPSDLSGLVVRDKNWEQIMADHGCC